MPAPNHDVTITAQCNVFTTSNTGYVNTVNLGMRRVSRDIHQVSSVNTPHFGELKRFALPINAYQKWRYILKDPRGTMSTTRRMYSPAPTGTVQYYDRTVMPLGSVTPAVDPGSDVYQAGTIADDPYPLAVARLQERISSGNAQMGIFLAESGKTAAHLAHTATRIYNALRALKKCRFGEFTSALGITVTTRQTRAYYSGVRVNHGRKNKGFQFDKKSSFSRERQESRFNDFAAKTWLEYTYGWKPLLNDVYQHAEALANVATRSGMVMRKCDSSAKSHKDKISKVSVDNDRIIATRVTSSHRRLRICVEFKIPTGVMDYANTFGLTDPLSVAWEVVPFSFVVDWFLPIGNFLEGLSTYNNLVFHRGYKSGSHKYYASTTTVPGPFKPNWAGDSTLTVDVASFTNSLDSFSFGRDLLNSFPSTPWPKWRDPRSISHGLSAVALLKTLFIPSNGVRRL
jgi:hypothetical protein